MKPFTAFKFFIENKKKGMVCFIVLVFTVCAIALITGLVNSIPETAYDTNAKPLQHYTGIYSNDEPIKPSVVETIKNYEGTKRVIPARYSYTSISLAIGGNSSVPVVYTNNDDFSYFIDNTDVELKEGRLPENGKDELVVHWRIMKNKGWKIGDIVGSEVDSDEWFSGKYEIVGIMDGPVIMASGIEEDAGMDKESNYYEYLVFFKEGQRAKVNDLITSLRTEGILYFNYEETKESIENNLKSLSSTLLVIIIVVVLILSISVSALMYIIYLQRMDEFGILYALGYKRKFIRNMIVKEILVLNIFGWIFGLILSLLVVFLLNTFLYNPKGNIISVIDIKVLIYTGIIPLMVGIISIFPITKKLKKCDPIAIIERRD